MGSPFRKTLSIASQAEIVSSGFLLNRSRSARFPTSIDPSSRDSPNALAFSRVAARKKQRQIYDRCETECQVGAWHLRAEFVPKLWMGFDGLVI